MGHLPHKPKSVIRPKDMAYGDNDKIQPHQKEHVKATEGIERFKPFHQISFLFLSGPDHKHFHRNMEHCTTKHA
jgi:hypothetical protein